MTNLYADYTVDGYVTLELAQKAEADWQAGVLSLADLVTVINAYENHTKLSNPATQQALLIGGGVLLLAVAAYFITKKR